jgi:hypothetical protein
MFERREVIVLGKKKVAMKASDEPLGAMCATSSRISMSSKSAVNIGHTVALRSGL